MLISDWSSDVCSSDLVTVRGFVPDNLNLRPNSFDCVISRESLFCVRDRDALLKEIRDVMKGWGQALITDYVLPTADPPSERIRRSEEHTSELQSLMRISYAVFCLKNKNHNYHNSDY